MLVISALVFVSSFLAWKGGEKLESMLDTLSDESGQGLTEYALTAAGLAGLLAVLVTLALGVLDAQDLDALKQGFSLFLEVTR